MQLIPATSSTWLGFEKPEPDSKLNSRGLMARTRMMPSRKLATAAITTKKAVRDIDSGLVPELLTLSDYS